MAFPKPKFKILRRPEVCDRIGLSPAALYARLDKNNASYDPEFPRQISLGASAVGWIEAEVDAWIESRILASRSATAS